MCQECKTLLCKTICFETFPTPYMSAYTGKKEKWDLVTEWGSEHSIKYVYIAKRCKHSYYFTYLLIIFYGDCIFALVTTMSEELELEPEPYLLTNPGPSTEGGEWSMSFIMADVASDYFCYHQSHHRGIKWHNDDISYLSCHNPPFIPIQHSFFLVVVIYI